MRYDFELRRIESLKEQYPKGTKIECIQMNDPYHAVASGTIGTVEHVDDAGTIHMSWENGSSLGLIPGEDRFRIIRWKEIKKVKQYFKAMELYDDVVVYLSASQKVEIGDYAIYLGYDNEPVIAKVTALIDELTAITDGISYIDVISILDIKPYLEKQKKLIQKAKLIDKMKKEIELQKMEDMLKKHSTDNDTLKGLYDQYIELAYKENKTSLFEEEWY